MDYGTWTINIPPLNFPLNPRSILLQKLLKKDSMKKILTLSLAFSALVFSAHAQEQREMKKDKIKTERHERRMGEKKEMMQDLNLSEAQKTQLKFSRDEFKAKMDQLKSENLTEAQRSERRKALMTEQKAKMESILSAQQKERLIANRRNLSQKGLMDKKKMHGEKKTMLKEKLSLSDDQSAKLKAQHEVVKQRKLAIKNDNTLSDDAKKARMKDLKKETHEQRNMVLTSAQIEKMKEFKKEHKNRSSRKAKK